jgi:cholinesterase
VSEASKDLFQRSIIMSGSAFNNMYAAIPRRDWALRLSRSLNYTGPNNETQILDFLENSTPQAIFNAVGALLTPYERDNERLLNAFGPVIEPYASQNAFMLDHPEQLAINSWGNNVDIMIGATSFENGMLVNFMRAAPFLIPSIADFPSYVPYSLGLSEDERNAHGETLKATYYGLMEPSVTNPDGVVVVSKI